MKQPDDRDERVPIEPLSDTSWNRIERAVFEELDDRAHAPAAPRAARSLVPRWAAVALAAAVVLQGAVAAIVLLRKQDPPRPLASARFASGSEASEALLGDVALQLEPASALVVVENGAQGSLCVLERGAVRFSVPKRGARPAFVVQAGDARVEVIGTQFRVERVAGSAAIETYEGKVRVTARGATRFLTRGQRWSGALTPALTPAPALAPAPAPAPGFAPSSTAPTTSDVGAGFKPARSDTSPDQQQRFEQAAAREASDPQHALRIYRALAQETGAWAQNALYAAGRLELDLGHRQSATRTLRNYLDRHPTGANAADARALLQRLAAHKERVQP